MGLLPEAASRGAGFPSFLLTPRAIHMRYGTVISHMSIWKSFCEVLGKGTVWRGTPDPRLVSEVEGGLAPARPWPLLSVWPCCPFGPRR